MHFLKVNHITHLFVCLFQDKNKDRNEEDEEEDPVAKLAAELDFSKEQVEGENLATLQISCYVVSCMCSSFFRISRSVFTVR